MARQPGGLLDKAGATGPQQVPADWNATERPYRTGQCVHQLFEEQVRRTPGATALVAAEGRLDYAELNTRANRVAHLLRAAGAGPETLVAVCLERGPDLVVALLGVLKAGAAYVPLDPSHPTARLTGLLAQAGIGTVLSDTALAPVVRAAGALPLLVDRLPAGLATDDPGTAADPDNPAYVLFTSGSTGRPKGVVVPHRGVVNRLLWMRDDCGLRAGTRVLQKTPATFDVSVWEFFGPLAVGATLVLARPGGHRDPDYLRAVLAEERVDTVHFVPSMLREFLAALRGAGPSDGPVLPDLRRIVCSGEALGADLVRGVAELIGCEVFNLYGPTEASVDVTATRCLPGEPVTIGRPVANTRTQVLDPDGAPLPPGAAGELCLAGVQLARGYLGRPGLTAAAFRPDPAGPPGSRLYRTGDLARWTADGRLEYLGRLDHQVKIRGFRIELGEVEAVLTAHPQVRAAVVTARQLPTGEAQLVGYLVGTGPATPETGELRAHLGARLPDYMVPTAWVRLAALPLTSSGKTDRRALPAPDGQRPELATAYLAPRTATEAVLAGLWEELLGVAPVGVHDRFLDLGGQSLIATRLCARLRRSTGVELTPAELLASPTVEQLAARLPRTATDAPPAGIPPRGDGPVPLSAEQHRLWFLDRLDPGSTEYLMYDAHRLRGPLQLPALAAALHRTVQRHATLRTTFPARRGLPVQLIHRHPAVPLEVVDLSGAPEAEREERARAALQRHTGLPFALDTGPLLRLVVLRLAPEHHVLLAVVHPIVADDGALGVVWRDLSACYRAERSGGPAGPGPLPVEYADYAAWQRGPQGGAGREADLAHFVRELQPPPAPLALPLDGPRPPRRGGRDTTVAFTLDAELTAAVRRTAGAAGATPFMALLACFTAVLARTTGQRDLVVATFTANRTSVELEDLVGLFVNTLALRLPVDPELGFDDLLARTRRTALAAYRHQALPFDQLVGALRPPRDLSRNPVAQAAFQTLGPLADRIDLPGVEAVPYAQGQGGHPFDVLLTLRERGAGLDGELRCPDDLLAEGAARRLAADFAAFVRAATADPQLAVDRLGRPTRSEEGVPA
ncbi:amino acid adenylation domain-containing protein [Kitasatospora sp. NPDC058965]|uniref:amino acid adenylation domain-containing protein n=1 Tax=Kitasatospora sp. NPDC058965 TaxID=3346682 RepID=UPI003680859A